MNLDKSDNELMLEFSNCSGDSFMIIFNRYKNRILNFVLRGYLHNKDDSEDIVQKTFIKVYSYKYKYKPSYQFSTWIYTIAKNYSINELKRKEKFTTNDNDPDDSLPDEQSLNQSIESRDYNTLLYKIIQTLKPKYKEIIVLRYLEGFSYKEISRITSKRINTLKSHCKRGLNQIQEKLIKYGIEKE